MLYFPSSPPFAGVRIEGITGLLLLIAAILCIVRRTDFLKWCLVPAILLALYGLWTAHYFGKSMMDVRGALDGDAVALDFLRGVGYAAIGVLALVAHALSRYKDHYD